jgi:hypothetical protein
MIRAISRRIDSIEELECIECKEVEVAAVLEASTALPITLDTPPRLSLLFRPL